MVELSWMNTDAQTEVNMFLRATEMNPSQISLGGFFNVNRTLFKSVRILFFNNIIMKLIRIRIILGVNGTLPKKH